MSIILLKGFEKELKFPKGKQNFELFDLKKYIKYNVAIFLIEPRL